MDIYGAELAGLYLLCALIKPGSQLMFKWEVDGLEILATEGETCHDELTRYAEVNSTLPLQLKKFILP